MPETPVALGVSPEASIYIYIRGRKNYIHRELFLIRGDGCNIRKDIMLESPFALGVTSYEKGSARGIPLLKGAPPR